MFEKEQREEGCRMFKVWVWVMVQMREGAKEGWQACRCQRPRGSTAPPVLEAVKSRQKSSQPGSSAGITDEMRRKSPQLKRGPRFSQGYPPALARSDEPGVISGQTAINALNSKRVPVWLLLGLVCQ